MSELDARKQTILRAIIIEYVGAAEPIASEALVQKYELGVKSATVRNELAEMSDLGYLEQPHTSAGRIPSDLGYRYYVDRLIVERELDDSVRDKVTETTSEGDALQTMLRDTTRVVSRLTHQLTVATTVRDRGVTVKTAVISALGPAQALLVLVLSNGQVENRMVECPAGLTLQDIGVANENLMTAVVGKGLRTLAKAKATQTGHNQAVDKLLTGIWSLLRQMSKDLTRGTLVTEGEEFMFAQPEFQRNLGTLHDLLNQISHSDVLYEAVTADAPQIVTIGRENRQEPLRQLSIVRKSFYVGGNEAGVLAIVGPTRMDYDQSIPLVNFTAQALTSALTRFFG